MSAVPLFWRKELEGMLWWDLIQLHRHKPQSLLAGPHLVGM